MNEIAVSDGGIEVIMAFDGFVIANLVKDFNDTIVDGRIYKIAQPEADELLLTIKNGKNQYRLLLSASASLPLVYFTDTNKPSPLTAPNFCMLLRKHIQNGRITSITQPGLERIIRFQIEHLDEMGDLRQKYLIVEIMGKYSNIIFCNEENMIIDSIKHVSAQISSVREVLPGRQYFIPDTTGKLNPLEVNQKTFLDTVCTKPCGSAKALYSTLTGFSSAMGVSVCCHADIDSDMPVNALTDSQKNAFYQSFCYAMNHVREGKFSPVIYKNEKEPVEFSSIPLKQFETTEAQWYENISGVLSNYFSMKEKITRIRQKSSDLRKIVQTALERNVKKYDLQLKQLSDTEKREKYRVYGELINTYGYNLPENADKLEALNYYTNEMITIPLDNTLTPSENAKRYFDKYNKLKRTCEALTDLCQQTKSEIEHLESIGTALDIALSEEDLVQIKEELVESGYIKKHYKGKKVKITSKPFHYISSDGYHMYVGKNNYQNDELTFKFASGEDWWFHAKGIPGSHVVVKTNGDELPDRTFEEAAKLAAYYSKNRTSEKVEIDYIQKKHVKKPGGAKPGFVVYYTNFSMVIDTDISEIEMVSE